MLLGDSSTPVASQIIELTLTDWKTIDVNLRTRNGLTLHAGLVSTLRATAANFQMHLRHLGEIYANQATPALASAVQQSITNKLLEYAPTASSLQPSEPRDADELLQWMAIELATNCCTWLLPFIELLLTTLHERGFDLDHHDAAGRTLLTAYAGSSRSTAADVAIQLMRLGADASVTRRDGRSALLIWTGHGRADMLEAVLIGSRSGRFAGLQQRVDLWQRDASGRTLLECMQSKGSSLFVAAGVLGELQQHWTARERPLLQRILTAHDSLIPDLARLTLDYLDGGVGVAK